MRLYELNYLIPANLPEEEIKMFQEKVIALIQEEGGILLKINQAIKKNLAYPIQKNNQAYLVTTKFNFLPEKLEGLEKKLKKETLILRYLITTKKAPKVVALEKPLKIIKKREEPKVELKDIEKKLEEILGQYESQ